VGLFRLLFGLFRQRRRYRYSPRRQPARDRREPAVIQLPLAREKLPSAPDQLTEVMNASFEAMRLMSRGEFRVFQLAKKNFPDCLTFAQVSLGEILQTPSKTAFAAINAKRVDVLLVATNGYPLVAVEYQGAGHYQASAAARDAVKKEALRRAGVGYAEVHEEQTDDLIVQLIRDALSRARRVPDAPPAGVGMVASPR
jgi:Protein of unknown function (DUF2726)